MRTRRLLVPHQSLEEVLHKPGCPLCRFLKDFQAIHLQKDSAKGIRNLCNFHTWGIAAVQDAPAAAEAFIRLVNDMVPSSSMKPDCDVCRKVEAEEDLRIRELVTLLGKPKIVQWLRTEAVFCIPHATKLRQKVSLILTPWIDIMIAKYRKQLSDELLQLRNDPRPGQPGWGVFGRVAEFLVSQRGLRA